MIRQHHISHQKLVTSFCVFLLKSLIQRSCTFNIKFRWRVIIQMISLICFELLLKSWFLCKAKFSNRNISIETVYIYIYISRFPWVSKIFYGNVLLPLKIFFDYCWHYMQHLKDAKYFILTTGHSSTQVHSQTLLSFLIMLLKSLRTHIFLL